MNPASPGAADPADGAPPASASRETTPPAGGLLRAILHSFVSLMTGTVVQLALGVAIGRTLGPAQKGVFSFAQYCAALAVSGGEGIRSGYAFERNREADGLSGARSARDLWGAVLVLVGAASALIVTACVLLARRAAGPAVYPFLAIAMPAILYAQVVNLLWVIGGRIERLNVRNTLTSGAGSALVALLAVTVLHARIEIVLAIWTAGIVAAAAWSGDARPFVGGAPARPSAALLRELGAFSGRATLSTLTTFLARRVDVFIVASLVSATQFGVYTLAVASGELIFQVSSAITWATTGRVASLDLPSASALVARTIRSLLAVQLVAGTAIFLAGPALLPLVYGRAFAGAGGPLRLLMPGVVFYSADQLLSFYIAARTGRPGLLLAFETLALALCAVATLAGVHRFGIAGAAAANTITYVVSFVVKTTYFARTSRLPLREILVARPADLPGRIRRVLRTG